MENQKIDWTKVRITCNECGKDLGPMSVTTFGKIYRNYKYVGKQGQFCSEECFEKYIKQFEVEEYNGNKIYALEVEGAEPKLQYFPYWLSTYSFSSIEDCRKRIDMKHVGVCSKQVLAHIFDNF